MAAGLELWAQRAGASLRLVDDESRPQRAAQIFAELSASDCDIVLGPYGSDSVRSVARSEPDAVIWNHGAAANDVQRLPNVISIPSPSSTYLVALGRAVAQLRPGAVVTVVTTSGPFAEYAWAGFQAQLGEMRLEIAGRFSFSSAPKGGVDAALALGPVEKEVTFFRQLAAHPSNRLIGGVSPGLVRFPELLNDDPEGFLAPVQWHPSLGESPELGPGSSEVLADARAAGLPALDYIAAQVYAAALVASHCFERQPASPLTAVRRLRTSTFFGDFGLDPQTGEQRDHALAVIQWQVGRQELLAEPVA